MEHHLLSVVGLDVDGVIGSIESLFIDLFNVSKGDVIIIESLVFKCLCAHMVEILTLVGRVENYEALFVYADAPLNDCEDINENAFALELFYLYLLPFFLWDL
jgi:hypothetical protein